jgi:adenylyltransferase/sulfurtransferase
VLGVLPGVIGTLQGVETLKLVLGVGEPLIGRLLLFDALALSFRELTLKKDPDCPLCGVHRTITGLVDYEAFCGLTPAEQAEVDAQGWEIGAKELAARLERGDELMLVDVREPHEWQIAHLPQATLIPLHSVPARASELDSSREIVLYCHHGQRSMRALEFLRQAGFRKLKNLRGGIDAWSRDADPAVPRY